MDPLKEKFDNIVFMVDGGLGKNIMATVVVRNIRKKYPDKKIIVVCGYPDIFLNNPHIHKVFSFSNALYFYEDYIKNSKSLILKIEPYLHLKYLYKEWHLTQAWCDTLNLPFDNSIPELYFLENERKAAQIFIEKQGGSKKVVLLQWVGGPPPVAKNVEAQSQKRASMYRRSLTPERAIELVDTLNRKDYKVLSVQHPHHPDIKGATPIAFGTRSVLMLLPYVRFFIGIDSFLQHGAAALGKKGVVIWGGTHPTCLGYPMHINLKKEACPTPHCHRPNSYTLDIQPHGFMWDCPHNDACMDFKPGEILSHLKELG